MKLLLVFLFSFFAMVAMADAPSRAAAFAAKNAGDYVRAAQIFAQLVQHYPEDAELWFQYGLVLRFDGRLEEAMATQTTARKYAPDDVDIQLEIARLYFYQGDIAAANLDLEEIRATSPNYPGVAELQHQLTLAQSGKSATGAWWLTLAHEWSRLERGDQWQTNVVHINRSISADLSFQLHLEHAERYDNADYYAAVSSFYRFSPSVNLAGGLGSGIDEDYLPGKRIWLYGDRRMLRTQSLPSALWVTLDLNRSDYRDLRVDVAKPGVRVDLADRLEWSLQAILVDSSNAQRQNGWATRVAWSLQEPAIRLDAGYSNAPESEESVTLDTRSYFIGARWQFSSSVAVALSFAKEEREREFFRDVANVAFVVRY